MIFIALANNEGCVEKNRNVIAARNMHSGVQLHT